MNNSLIIVGPCAAETREQVMETAAGIAQCRDAHARYHYIYRAGIWKPRTSPDSFQGIGAEGLAWLQQVKETFHFDVATEVATIKQVDDALDAGIDYLWIGARTSANPIAVQTIADSLKGKVDRLKGVLVKNPVNEDAALWIGDIERLKQAGVPVVAVHRGCNHRPCWKMAYQLLKHCPDTPLIIDPSHLTGRADAVAQMCVKALRLGYQGWMIEAHCSPTQALSDASQQITPIELETILSSVERVSRECREGVDLDWRRCMIDEVDDDLWCNLVNRLEICRDIGAWKKKHGMAVVQPARYHELLQRRIQWGQQHGLDAEVVKQIMDAIHKESVRVQS